MKLNLRNKPFWLALALFVLALSVYGCSAVLRERVSSPTSAYFNQLAEAFLHGQTYLAQPLSTHDLTRYQGRWYVPFPPLPAFLLMPWVALSGVEQVNTVLFGAVTGAVNVVLVFLLLGRLVQRGWTRLSLSDILWLTALWGFGSVHWYMSTLGSVWFVSQICTVTFILLAVWLALATGSPLLSGIALAVAMWGRPHVALSYPLLLAIGFELSRNALGQGDWRRLTRWALLSLLPLLVSGTLLLAYNYLRFDNGWDFGYQNQNVARELAHDLLTYGQFNLRYILHNLWAMWLAGPMWDAPTRSLIPDRDGMSLLLTTPPFYTLCAPADLRP